MTTILQKVAEIFNPRAASEQEELAEDADMGRPEGTGPLNEDALAGSGGTPAENQGVNQGQSLPQDEEDNTSGLKPPSGRTRHSRRDAVGQEDSPYVTSFFLKAKRKKSPEGIGRRTRSRTTPPPDANQGGEGENVISSSQESNWSLMSTTPESSMEIMDPSAITNVPLHLSNFKLSMTLKTDDVNDPGTTLTIGTRSKGRGVSASQDILGSARISRGSRTTPRGDERTVPQERDATPDQAEGISTPRVTRASKTPETTLPENIIERPEDSQRTEMSSTEEGESGDFIDQHEQMDIIDEEHGTPDMDKTPLETGEEQQRELRSKSNRPSSRQGEKAVTNEDQGEEIPPGRLSPIASTPSPDKERETAGPRTRRTSASEESLQESGPSLKSRSTSGSKEPSQEPLRSSKTKRTSVSKEPSEESVPSTTSKTTTPPQQLPEESGPSTRTRKASVSKEPSQEPAASTRSRRASVSKEPSQEPPPSTRTRRNSAAKEASEGSAQGKKARRTSPASKEQSHEPTPSTRSSSSKEPSREPPASGKSSATPDLEKGQEKRSLRSTPTPPPTVPEEPEIGETTVRDTGRKQPGSLNPQSQKTRRAAPETFIGAARGQQRTAFRKKPQRKSERAGTVFPVGRIHRLIKEQTSNKVRVSVAAAVYAAAAIEYLVAEVTEISGMVAKDNGKKRISPQHLQRTVKGDTELEQLFHRVIIPESGVQPYIHPALLPKSKPPHGKEIPSPGTKRPKTKSS